MTAVAQPSGTVTLVFTDIEGSTRLLDELGVNAYREALAEHRRIVREACARFDGYEVDYEGDAFFYAFASAQAAVSAVSEAMGGLDGGPIRIRVGIHTGEPALDPPKYVGIDVHRAARIMSAAHGGQIILSAATVELLDASPALEDLGDHRFKDFGAPERIYQLGSGSFPPLKTISNTNLPRPASSFVGREHELIQVLARIEQGARLVTLTGPGGTGKTRLALEAASSLVPAYKAGVFWVGLAGVRDPGLVTDTISQMLGATDTLAEHVGERELLLLLDNLEQVIEAAGELAALVERCPNLALLVTSRELLRVRGEVEYPVPPLAEPEAVTLFCERAQLSPSDEIAELCARLDSLPLAVELAAARTKALSPAQILARLSQRLDLLKGGRDADPRQETLRATIEWSYELLTPQEQALFARLSVFAAGCTLATAEEIADADLDTLQSLVEKSLLRFSVERYWMLETIRGYSSERLELAGEADSMRDRHLTWVARESYARARAARQNAPEAHAFLQTEQLNIRDALTWAIQRGAAEPAQQILAGSFFHWLTRGQAREGDDWASRIVAIPSEPTALSAWAFGVAAEFPRYRGDPARARPLQVRTLEILEELGDDDPEVASMRAATLSSLSDVLGKLGDLDEAFSRAEQALAIRRRLERPTGISHALDGLAAVTEAQGRPDEALAIYEESVALLEASGELLEAGETLPSVARLRLLLGDRAGARDAAEEALRRTIESGDGHVRAHALAVLGLVTKDDGNLERATQLLGEALAEAEDSGLELEQATEIDAVLDGCKTALGSERFSDALAAGSAAARSRESRT